MRKGATYVEKSLTLSVCFDGHDTSDDHVTEHLFHRMRMLLTARENSFLIGLEQYPREWLFHPFLPWNYDFLQILEFQIKI